MKQLPQWKPGDELTAERLNEMQRAAGNRFPQLGGGQDSVDTGNDRTNRNQQPLRIVWIRPSEWIGPHRYDIAGSPQYLNPDSHEWEDTSEDDEIDNLVDPTAQLVYPNDDPIPCLLHWSGNIVPLSGNSVHLVAMPICGRSLPARDDTTSGTQTCCMFAIDSETEEIVQIVDEDGNPFQAVVYNIYTSSIPARQPPNEEYFAVHYERGGRWLCERPVGGSAGPTTTTLMPPVGQPVTGPCMGQCKFTWNGSTWDKDDEGSNCHTNTSTTSTTPSPLPCVCPTTTTTTSDPGSSTTTSTTSTTTTTTPSPCGCRYPTFCGSEVGECTYTQCAKDPADPPSNLACTTTTTYDPLGPTTTTCNPATGPGGGIPECQCNWTCTPFGWQRTGGDCPQILGVCPQPSDPCPAGGSGGSPGGGASACTGGYGGTGGSSGGGGGGGGGGECQGCGSACYWWSPTHGQWMLVSGCGCVVCDACSVPYYGSCWSEPPSSPGSGWNSLETAPCVSPCKPYYTTTTTPNPCGAGCKFQGDGEGGWTFISASCSGGCTCTLPYRESLDDCEVIVTRCAGTTLPPTTTTLPPTTTTTTKPWWCLPGLDCSDATCFQASVDELGETEPCSGPHATAGACNSVCPEEPPTTTTTTTTTKPWYCIRPYEEPECDAASCIEVPNEDDPWDYGHVCGGPFDTSGECNEFCDPEPTTTTCDPMATCENPTCPIVCNGNPGIYVFDPIGCAGNCECSLEHAEYLYPGLMFSPCNAPSLGGHANCCNTCPGAGPCFTTTTTPAP